jgi:hypothetical protein
MKSHYALNNSSLISILLLVLKNSKFINIKGQAKKKSSQGAIVLQTLMGESPDGEDSKLDKQSGISTNFVSPNAKNSLPRDSRLDSHSIEHHIIIYFL